MAIERVCEAQPFHAPGCNGRGESEDHFTPKCIARLLGWTNEEINASENKQWLSFACHAVKDATTHNRFKLLISQLSKNHTVNLDQIKVWSRRENRLIDSAKIVNGRFVELLTIYLAENGKDNLTPEIVETLWGKASAKKSTNQGFLLNN